MSNELDLGTDPARDRALLTILAEYPCSGGCGRIWDEAGGGWTEYEARDDGAPGAQTAPRWYCGPCHAARSAEMPLNTAPEVH